MTLRVLKQSAPLAARTTIYMAPGTSCADIAREIYPAINDNSAHGKALRDHVVIFLGDEEIKPEDWSKVKPESGAHILVSLRAAGDGLRTLFQTALTVVIAAVAVFFGVPPNIAWAAASAVSALITNALIKPPEIDAPSNKQTYSIEGARNQLVQLNDPVPLFFGQHRYVPKLLGPPLQDVVGEDIYLILALVWAGQDIELTNFRIGDTAVDSFADVTYQHSLTAASPAPTLYPGAVGVTTIGTVLASDANPENNAGPWVTATSPPDAETIKLIGSFPRGLGWLKNGQEKKSQTRGFDIQYRAVGDAAWQSTSAATIVEGDQAAVNLGGENRRGLFGSVINELADYVAEVNTSQGGGSADLSPDFTRSDLEPFYWQVEFAVPSGPAYEVRMRKKAHFPTPDDAVDEIRWEVMQTYTDKEISPDPRLATTHVRIRATDQLNGYVDSFNADIASLVELHNPPADPADADGNWGALSTSRNPADELIALWQGAQNARPLGDDEINWSSLSEFWNWCSVNGYTCDLLFDGPALRRDTENTIAGCGRARVITRNGQKTVIIDREKPRSGGVATAKNGWDFRFDRIFPPDVHALRVDFQNRDIGYRQDQLFIYAPGYDAASASLIERFPLPGRTTAEAVTRDGMWFLRTSALQNWRGSFMMDIEHLTMEVGDRIPIPHRQMDGAPVTRRLAGLTDINGDLTGILLDEDVELGAGSFAINFRRLDGTAADSEFVIVGPEAIEQSGGRFSALTFPSGHKLTAGDFDDVDLVWIGSTTTEIMEGVITAIEPARDLTARLHWVEYAPQRFTDAANVPITHVPVTPPPLAAPPPAPELRDIIATFDSISVHFFYDPALISDILRFKVRYRQTPDTGAAGAWTDLPDLLPVARVASLPPGLPGRTYEIRIVAESRGARVSDPLIVTAIAPRTILPAPLNPVVTPDTIISPTGVSVPRVTVRVPLLDGNLDPVIDPAVLDSLVIETRLSDDGGQPGAWQVNTTAPASAPEKALSSLQIGQNIDVRLSWKDKRGAQTEEADRTIVSGIAVPGNLVASDANSVGGNPAATVNQSLIDLASFDTVIDGRVTDAETGLQALDDGLNGPGGTIDQLQIEDANQAVSITALTTRADNARAVTVGGRFADVVHFAGTLVGAPDTIAALSVGTAITGDSDFGNCREFSGRRFIYTRKCLPAVAGRIARIALRQKCVLNASDGNSNDTLLIVRYLKADYADNGFLVLPNLVNNLTVADGVADVFYDWTVPSLPLNTAWLRFYIATSDDGSRDAVNRLDEFTAVDFTAQQGVATNAANLLIADAARLTGDNALSDRLAIQEAEFGSSAAEVQAYTQAFADADTSLALRSTQLEAGRNADSRQRAGGDFSNLYRFVIGPTGTPIAATAFSAGTAVTGDADFGRAQQITGRVFIYQRETIPFVVGNTVTLRVRQKCTINASTGGNRTRLLAAYLDADFGLISAATVGFLNTDLQTTDGVSDERLEFELPSGLSVNITQVRFYAVTSDTGSQDAVNLLKLFTAEDDTLYQANLSRTAINQLAINEIDGRTQAHLSLLAGVPGGLAQIILNAIQNPGETAYAKILMVFDELGLLVNGTPRTALDVYAGLIRANVLLQASAGILVGPDNTQFRVAVRAETFFVTDGDVISFGFDLGEYDVEYSAIGIDTLATGETYVPYSTNKTGTGFTVNLDITTQGTPTSVTENTVVTTPTGPDYMLAKSETEKANNDVYDFYASGTVSVFAFEEFESPGVINYSGSVSVRFWYHDGTSWIDGGTRTINYSELGINPTHSSGLADYDFTDKKIASRTYADPIRSSASLGCFGLDHSGQGTGDIDAFTKVVFTKATQSGTRTATPDGQFIAAKVIPL